MDSTTLVKGGFIDQYIWYNVITKDPASLRAAATVRFGTITDEVYQAAYQIAQQSRTAGNKINAPNRKAPLPVGSYPSVGGYFDTADFGGDQFRWRVDVSYDVPGSNGQQQVYTVYVNWKYSADPEMLHRAAIEEFLNRYNSTGYSVGRVGYGDINRTDVIYGFRG